ncbi:16S rRNA (guanine(966)-N(2))-methyltransferase RsmD [Candidatus Pelagibacter sp.]|jgi:16S rRNA (guanine966-N2)-methyltransferase|nr:16S rRNA (guanine(966)-N(2))-methyltransferase RsmD [Candidatus Pelagibacter sp.]|tara:strand:+ start:105 stop:671 length:567 start_codon:yes stop_codon:yes gene_type:complete
MRIISGLFKGKKILEPRDIRTRPLKDLTKESIFNIIKHSKKFEIDLKNSNILDLFSGVGSFGIECLSRGVKKVVFVENYSGVLSVLKKNLTNLKLIDNYEIIEKDIYNKNLFTKLDSKFNVIFLDPPYKDRKLENILFNINNEEILNQNGIIIIHRHKNEQDIIPTNFEIVEEKKYGISKILFLSCSS